MLKLEIENILDMKFIKWKIQLKYFLYRLLVIHVYLRSSILEPSF